MSGLDVSEMRRASLPESFTSYVTQQNATTSNNGGDSQAMSSYPSPSSTVSPGETLEAPSGFPMSRSSELAHALERKPEEVLILVLNVPRALLTLLMQMNNINYGHHSDAPVEDSSADPSAQDAPSFYFDHNSDYSQPPSSGPSSLPLSAEFGDKYQFDSEIGSSSSSSAPHYTLSYPSPTEGYSGSAGDGSYAHDAQSEMVGLHQMEFAPHHPPPDVYNMYGAEQTTVIEPEFASYS